MGDSLGCDSARVLEAHLSSSASSHGITDPVSEARQGIVWDLGRLLLFSLLATVVGAWSHYTLPYFCDLFARNSQAALIALPFVLMFRGIRNEFRRAWSMEGDQ